MAMKSPWATSCSSSKRPEVSKIRWRPGGQPATPTANVSQQHPSPTIPDIRPSDKPATTSGPGDLEETWLPSKHSDGELREGSRISWGQKELVVEKALPRSWYLARSSEGNLVAIRPGEESAWAKVGDHPIVPEVIYVGSEGTAVRWTDVGVVSSPVDLPTALSIVIQIAQLACFLEAKGFSLIDLDPQQIVLDGSRVALRLPPKIGAAASNLPKLSRDGFTPPEVFSGGVATGREGVYVIGALFYWLLTGSAPPDSRVLESVPTAPFPGIPQLFSRTFAPAGERLAPREFLGALRGLEQQPVLRLRVGAATTIGLNPERQVNEDSQGALTRSVTGSCGEAHLLRACVADGMGGMAAGEIASGAAVAAFLAGEPPHPLDAAEAQADWTEQLAWDANEAVLTALSGQDGGTTLTGVMMVGARYSVAHVGDSRAYLLDGPELIRLTKDHSLVEAMMASGVLSKEEAEVSPDKNKILRSLGSVRQRQPGYVDGLTVPQEGAAILLPGQALVLMTDGIWGEVPESLLAGRLSNAIENPDMAARALVDAAIEAGAPDNATAVVIYRSSEDN